MVSAAWKNNFEITIFLLACVSASSCSQKTNAPGPKRTTASTAASPGSNGTTTTGGGFSIAAHSALPRVLDNGGRMLTSPVFVPITFSGDAWAASLDQFITKFAASAEWSQMASEYGVGAATAGTAVQLSQTPAASLTNAQIQSWLSTELHDAARPLGSPNSSAIYTIFYPQSTSIDAGGIVSCTDFAGYHDEFVDAGSGLKISYAVIARCSGDTVNTATETTSHELLEAATDPDNDVLAYYGVASDFNTWATLSGGVELGDMCQLYASSTVVPSDIGFAIQRTWSNAAAAAGGNPCVGALAGQVYYNSAPVLTDTVTYLDPTNNNQSTSTRGVSIPVGSSKTIELDLYSSAATSGPWTLSAQEDNGGSDLSFSFDKTTGKNGDKIHLTIHVNSKDSSYNGEAFWIKSSLNGVNYYWPVMVGN